MKKYLSILIVIGIILAGVWVFKTRTPLVLSPADPMAASTQLVIQATATPVEPQPSTSPGAGDAAEKSPVRKIADSLKGSDQRKFLILEEILKSKNDNDQRLDSEFKNMTPALMHALTQFYNAIPREGFNERGTIAFLYARSMKTPEDVEFPKRILSEKPCLSLGDCSKDAPPATREEEHLQGISETTANYPQLTALKQSYDQYRAAKGQSPPNEALASSIIAMFREKAHNAENSRVREECIRYLKFLKQPL